MGRRTFVPVPRRALAYNSAVLNPVHMSIWLVWDVSITFTSVQGAGFGRVPGSQRWRPAHRADGPEAAAVHLPERHSGGVGHADRGGRAGLAANRGKASFISRAPNCQYCMQRAKLCEAAGPAVCCKPLGGWL